MGSTSEESWQKKPMTIDDFVRNRWADAKEALRELDSDFVSALESRLEIERIGLLAPPVMVSNSEKQPTKRLSKSWHSLLEACFELTVMTRNYQACCRNLTSDAVSGMDDFEAGRLFAYSYYTWVFYQDAVVEHTKTIISHVSRVYGARDGTPTQLKKLYHEKADTLKKRTEEARNAIAHGGGFISRALTEDQWWEASAALGTHPSYLLDEHHYAERGQSVRSGSYDQIMKTGPQGFLDEVARLLHDFEQKIDNRWHPLPTSTNPAPS